VVVPDLELSLGTFHVGYLKFEVLELDSLGCNSETGLLEPGSFGSNQAGSGVGSAQPEGMRGYIHGHHANYILASRSCLLEMFSAE